MSIPHKFIGKMVKGVRTRNKMSQATLAEKIDMSVAYISYIETAKKRASLDTLAKIASALGVTIDYLMCGNHENSLENKQSDFDFLLKDCNNYERQVIYENACSLKRCLRDNCELFGHQT